MLPNTPGLSNEEVDLRLKNFGPNVLPERPPPGNLALLFDQVKNPLIYILILAGGVTALIGHPTDSLIIFLAVLANTVLGFVQERRASDALFALKHYVESKVTVIREGRRVVLETRGLVPGDVVILNQGTKVPADGKLLSANRLYLDEAVLTGESVSVGKVAKDDIFMGTTVASGQATMIVELTGESTRMGAIALNIQEQEEETPLQKQLKIFSKQILKIVSLLILTVFVVGLLYKLSFVEVFTISVALAVSSIPEGLIVSLTVVLAIGMQKILKHKGLVKKLAAAETLGGVTTICIDKTGTLTQGKMKVTEIVGNKKELAEQVLLANDLDDPIVIAAFEWGRSIIGDFVSEHTRLDSIPFSIKDRIFVSLNKWSNEENRLFVNGAPEMVLEYCNLSGQEKEKIYSVINDLAGQGRRLIGFARKDLPKGRTKVDITDTKTHLSWVGLIAFTDPVRLGVKEALEKAHTAGIKTIVITGDFSKTTEYVLSELGITLKDSEIVVGEDLKKMGEAELLDKCRTARLFARTTPDDKLRIVQALKERGEVVAMMGDGVNDAPALHRADIGIVVGEASDVAKESADLVLLDSNFATIVEAVEEGRGMFENIRKIILYLLSDAFQEIVVVLGGMVLGLPLPLTAVQILWINLVSDGLPNLTLTIDPKRHGIMEEAPRAPEEKLVTKWMIALIGFVSIVAGLMSLAAFAVIYKVSGDATLARSVAFLTLGLNSLVYVFSVRALLVPFWQNHVFENKLLIVAVVIGAFLQSLPFVVPELRQFFGLSQLSVGFWGLAVAMSLTMFSVVEGFKFVYEKRSRWLSGVTMGNSKSKL